MAQSQPRPAPTNASIASALEGVELVIFDFDGVIADSEVLSLGTLRQVLSDYGMPMSTQDVQSRFLGTSLATILDFVAQNSPRRTVEDFAADWKNGLYHRLRTELKPINSIISLLVHLEERGIRHCIASSSTFERIGLSLVSIGLETRFPEQFSAEQVRNGKPAPDLFLLAARRLKTEPKACLVIEDSPHGVQAARAAGMRVIGFLGGTHLKDIQEAHSELLLKAGAERVLRDFAELCPKSD